jgi:hypothetical protein
MGRYLAGGVVFVAVVGAALVLGACDVRAQDWPDRTGRTPSQMLNDLVVRQEHKHVRESYGEWREQCFTDEDFAAFRVAATPRRIVERLKQAPDFVELADALRALPPDQRAAAYQAARQLARPTWRQMGFIDRQGRGQTEAGHAAELQIAAAIVEAFAAEAPAP